MDNTRLRRLSFAICVYGALPIALICSMLVGWMVSVENATTVLQSADSADGSYRAEVVREDPGVSSGYEYMVRVMPANLSLLAKSLHMLPFSTVFVALEASREPDKLTVQWSGPQQVTIRCAGCGGMAAGKEKWRDLVLKYELK